MKTWNLLLIVLAIVLIISIFSVWFVPSVQAFMVGNPTWNGIKSTLKEINGRTVGSMSQLPSSPQNSVLITVPALVYNQPDLEKMKSYVENGGTLLLADDYGFGNGILAYLGVATRFNGAPLLDPLFCYKNPSFPKITDFSPDIISQDITQVVFNHATALDNVPEEYGLAWSSPTSFLDTNGDGKQGADETATRRPVAARIPIGKGFLVLVADPSILINTMANRYDNLAFIKSIIKWDTTQNVMFDQSHLSAAPLDTSKKGLINARDWFAQPYPTLAIIGIIFISVSLLLLRTGGSLGRQP